MSPTDRILTLRNGITYRLNDYVFHKDVPTPISDDRVFYRLINSGVFEETPPLCYYHIRHSDPASTTPRIVQMKNGDFLRVARDRPIRMSRWHWQQIQHHQYLEVMPPLDVIKNLGKDDFSLLMVRDMGIGDVIICTDVAYNLKKAFPYSKITFATTERHKPILNGLDFIDEVVTIGTVDPVHWDISVNLCGYCEQYPSSARYHRADLLGQAFGSEFLWSEERGVHLTLSIEEEKWFELFNAEYNPTAKPVVALQPYGSSAHRSLQLESILGLSRWLIQEGYHVYIYGQNPNLGLVQSTNDLTILNDCLEIREIFAIIKNSEFVVTPDSSGYHIAAAFDVPSFPAFTTIHEQVRVRDYHRCYPIRITDLNCSPCWDAPCGTVNCPCVTYLTAERLIEHVQNYRSQGYPHIQQPEYHPVFRSLR